jgi:hypothetical protein
MGATAASWKKQRLQVRRGFAGSSQSNSVMALGYIEIDRFVKDFLSMRMSTFQWGNSLQQDLSATFPPRLASVMARNDPWNVRSSWLYQRDKSLITMISELARCALRQWESLPAQPCNILSCNGAKSTSRSNMKDFALAAGDVGIGTASNAAQS